MRREDVMFGKGSHALRRRGEVDCVRRKNVMMGGGKCDILRG